MDKRGVKRLEKVLFSILGRQPDVFGLIPDEEGWISIKELYHALISEPGFPRVTPRGLNQFFSLYRPEKFECRNNLVRVKPEYQKPGLIRYNEDALPPECLYVNIRPKAHRHVIANGLRSSADKKWVVLSRSREMALRIGKHRDRDPVIAEVRALKASNAGVVFKKAGDTLYLVEGLDTQWMNIPYLPPAPEEKKSPDASGPGRESRPGKRNDSKGRAWPLEEIGGFVVRKIPSSSTKSSEIDKKRGKNKRSRSSDPEWKKARRMEKKRKNG